MSLLPATLTRAHVDQVIRLAWLIGVLCMLVASLWLFVPLPRQPTPSDIVQASIRPYVTDDLFFARYSELSSARKSPFDFQELVRTEVQTRQREPEPEPEPSTLLPVAPPPVQPDVAGLSLVGTAPGGSRPVAMLLDQQTGLTSIVGLNDQVRNATLEAIHNDNIVLIVDQQRAELTLTAIDGSDDFNRQLSGQPPQPREPGQGAPAAMTMVTAPTATSFSPRNNAVLSGVDSQGTSGAYNSVITQSAAPMQTPTGQPQGDTAPSSQDQGSASNQASQSAPSVLPSSSETSASASPERQRSLGISGHMLGLAQQQELSLNQTGLMVTAVRNEQSSIQVGDVVLSIGGRDFTNLADAKNIINSQPGDTAELQLFRNGSMIAVTANLD